MAINADEGGHRAEPGLGLALLTVLVMVVTTGVLAALIYLLMLGVSATSSGSGEKPALSAPALQTETSPIAAPPASTPTTK